MNIALLTDLHIGKEEEDTYQVDVRKNLLSVLEAIQEERPDRIVVAGDLCLNEGDLSTYQWIKEQLDGTAIPYDLLVGNHDNGAEMAEVFGLEADFKHNCLCYARSYEHWNTLFLDTGVRTISEEQLHWLSEQLATSKKPTVIFMHHPPLYSDVPFMDGHHALQNMESFQKILIQDTRVFPIFTGHYHVEKTVYKENMILQITPSCFFQIDQSTSVFQVDHYRIAYRKIELLKDSWRSTVRYLEGNKIGI